MENFAGGGGGKGEFGKSAEQVKMVKERVRTVV